MPFKTAVNTLRLLTPRLVAYGGGVREIPAVHQWWPDGTREAKSGDIEDRLRFALQVALLLSEHDQPQARIVHPRDRPKRELARIGCHITRT